MTTELIIYDDREKFWTEVSPHLKTEEGKNSLLLGLSYLFRKDPKDCLYQSALWEGSRFLGALVCSGYLTHKNLLPSPIQNMEHLKTLLNAFLAREIKPTGIVGERDTVALYQKQMKEIGWTSKVNVDQGIYRCAKVVHPQELAGVKFRWAEMEDASVLGEWIETFHKEAVPFDPPVNGRQLAESKIGKKLIYVLERDGELLSMAGYARDIETSCSINLVFTPKHLRGRGFASAVTAQLTQYFLNNGKREVYLYTDMANPTSNKIYQQIGYVFVCHYVHLAVT